MNKIFRVIYSQATQSWVAVSELTKAHKKQSSSNAQKNAANISGSVFKSSVIALGLLTGANTAYAVNTAGTGGGGAVAWGPNSVANPDTSVAIGNGARANNPDGVSIGATAVNGGGATGAIAIGKNAKNDQKESIAIGVSAKNVGANTIAIGSNALTQDGPNAIAIGSNTVAKTESVVLGNDATAGSKSISIGYKAKVTAQYGIAQGHNASSSNTDAIAVGRDTQSTGGGSVALGQEAKALGNHSLAIGPQATASATLGDAVAIGYNSKATEYRAVAIANEAVASGENAVSIGWYANAAGKESATLGDHAQAKAEHSIAIGSFSNAREENAIALGTRADAANRNALSLGTSSHAGLDAVAVGYSAEAADNSVAIGSESASLNEADIAIGKGARAIGKQGAIAAGLGTRAIGHSSIMIGGSDISEAANQTVKYDVEDHTKVTDVTVDEMINGAKVKRHYKVIDTTEETGTLAAAYKALTGKPMDTSTLDYSKVTNGHSSISLGIHALSEGNLGTAIGTGARANSLGSIALGAGAVADRQNAVAIGTGSTTELQGSRQTDVSYNAAGSIVSSDSPDVAYTFKWAGGINTSAGDVVSFGSAGAERQLKNVAAGRVAEDSTDAINGSQLNSVARKVASGWQVAGDNKTKVSGIGSDDQVNFINGNGTTVTVTDQPAVKETVTENGKQVEKITTPKGANVKFDVKAADTSLEVGANGVKVKASDGIETTTDGIKVNTGKGLKIDTADGNKVAVDTDGTTITVDNKGKVKAVTGSIETVTDTNKGTGEKVGQVRPVETDKGKLATVDAVASAINDAYWKAAASGNGVTTDVADNVKAGDTVTFKAGKNLTVSHTANSFEFATTDTPEFTSVQFGNNGPKITNDGDNLKVTKADGTSSTKITNVANGSDGNDAVNVNQLKASGWKVAGNNKTEVDTINPSEQVNFLDGSGTTVTVEKDKGADGKENGNVNVKYDVNVGNGLQTANNTISVKPADRTITVGTDGVKVNTGDIATESTGKATTALDKAIAEATKELAEATEAGDITAQQKAQEKLDAANKAKADAGKQIATVENVTEAINKAGWNAIAAKTENGEVSGEATQLVKPGETVTFEADKNIKIAQDGSKFTFSTKDNVEFKSVKVGEDKDGKKPVSLTTSAAITANNNQTGKAPTTALNISSGTGTDAKPTQITGVGSVLNTTTVTSAPDGTALITQPKLVNLGTAHNQTALADNVLNSAATVRDLANMGWKVSSDKATGAENKSYSDVVRNADEVKFVGINAAKVSGKTENGVRTITVDVKVPDVKTAKLVSSTDGSVIAPSTDSKLQDALKTAKDELAALPNTATKAAKEAAENKVKVAETALNKALDDKGVATAKNVADMINNSGFTLKTSADEGKKDAASAGSEVIKPGKAVEMVAGKNLTVKQEANGKVTYSLNPELINLTSAEFKGTGKNAPTTKLTNAGITITSATVGKQPVSLTENGLNNGGNAISNVAGNLDGAKTGTTAPTTSATKPTALTETNAATVGDVLNSGWNIQEKGTAKDFVKAYDTVNFAQGDGTDVSVSVSDDKQTSTVKYSVKADGNSLEVGANGVKVKVSDGIETTKNGIAVKAADKTLTVGTDGVKVNTGAIAAANGGKVTVTPKTKADGTTETQAEAETRAASEIATVKNVADAINSAAWIAKVENTDDSVDTPTENDKGTAVKAGDTLNLKAGKNLRVKRDGGNITFALAKDITVETANVENTLSIGKDGAKVNIAPTANGLSFSRPAATAGGAKQPVTLSGISSGLDKFDAADPKTEGLLNLNKTEIGKTEPTVGDNTAATVGDLRGMGWVLSADKETDNPAKTYNAQVKNAEEVKFVGASGVIVSGKTDGNVRTITVGVDHQLATNNSVKPVEYTKKDGTKVYPKTVTKNDGTTETKFYPNADGTGDEVPAGDVIVSVNGANGTTTPTTLSNVKSNLPETRNTADAANPTDKPASKSQSAPTIGTADGNVNANNAATVGDVLNSGWNLKGNGSAVDFVRAYDTVNFVNGKGTTVSIETDGAESRVKVDVDTGVITAETKDGKATGKVAGPVANAADLSKAIKDAQDELAKAGDEQAKKAAQTKLDTANKAADEAGLNKVATAQNVADMINNSGFTLKTSATAADDNLTADNTLKNDGEVINLGKTVEMVAGKNLTVKQDADGKVTYATASDVAFNTVKVGAPETYRDDQGNTVVKVDGKFYKADNVENGKPKDDAVEVAGGNVTTVNPQVNFAREDAKPATNNGTDAKNQPSSALNISSTDGKPTQLTGVASSLNDKEVETAPKGKDGKRGSINLVDLNGKDSASVNKNAAATVGDLQNMGWVVSTKDGNGYTDVVKNANKVDFKGGNGIEVRGSTAADGTRVITVSAKEGKVTNKVEITKNDGSKVHAVIIDGKYYERDENGKPKTDTNPDTYKEIPAADIKSADNGGSGFVTGNTVANAINDSGWNVGLADGKKAEAAFAGGGKALSESDLEKVNPDDNFRFADGKNTKVKAATVAEINKDGRKITNTYVKFDVELPIGQIENVSRDAGGNAVKKVGDKWYPTDQVNEDGTLKNPGNSTALSDEEAEKVATGNVAAMDPENKGDKYKSAHQVEKGLTPVQMGELAGMQVAAAEAAKLKIENLLKNQPKDVVDAASEAAVKAAQDEAKVQYLKEKGLDKGTGGTVISNLARGTAPGDAVNVDQLQNSGWNLDSKAVAGSSGKVISGNVSPSKVKMDETVNIDAGNNIEITRNGKNIEIATSMAPQFSSVSLGAGADAPTLSVDGDALNVGSKKDNNPVRITNVAPGVKEGDVTNVAQLKGVAQNLNNRIDNVDGNARAGIAQAIATAGLVQAYLPGKSMMAIGGGTYRGEAGYAIGYSSISDGGNWIIKGTASGNSRGHFGASASVGYQW